MLVIRQFFFFLVIGDLDKSGDLALLGGMYSPFILQVVLNWRFSSTQKIWDQIMLSYNQGCLKTKGCKIEGPL